MFNIWCRWSQMMITFRISQLNFKLLFFFGLSWYVTHVVRAKTVIVRLCCTMNLKFTGKQAAVLSASVTYLYFLFPFRRVVESCKIQVMLLGFQLALLIRCEHKGGNWYQLRDVLLIKQHSMEDGKVCMSGKVFFMHHVLHIYTIKTIQPVVCKKGFLAAFEKE